MDPFFIGLITCIIIIAIGIIGFVAGLLHERWKWVEQIEETKYSLHNFNTNQE